MWHRALARIAAALNLPEGASLSEDVPQAVEDLLATAGSNRPGADSAHDRFHTACDQNRELRDLLVDLTDAALKLLGERRAWPGRFERHAYERLWSVLDRVRGAIGPLGEETNDASSSVSRVP